VIAFASVPTFGRRSLRRRAIAIFLRGETSMIAVRLARANGTEAKCRLDGRVLDLWPVR
jgi:hypothetical protein